MTRLLLAFLTALAAAHNRRLLAEAAAGCPDKVPAPDDLYDVARAVGGTSPIYDGLLAEEFAREIDFRLDDVVREWAE